MAEHASSAARGKRGKGRLVAAVVAAVALVFCVGSFALDSFVLGQMYARYPGQASLLLTDTYIAQDYPMDDVSFELDGQTLRGHVYGADSTRGLIVFRHGIFSQHQDYLALITAMVDRGWRVFAYDAIGCGESDGDSTIGFSQSPIDVAAAVEFAREAGLADDGMPIALWGHSWGGFGVAGALARTEDVGACVTMSGFDSPFGILSSGARSSYGALGATQAPFMELATSVRFGADANPSASRAIAESGVPTLVIHGAGDETVPYEGQSILWNLSEEDELPSNVMLITKSDPGRDGHNDYFYSPESQAYFDECVAGYLAAIEAAGGDADAPEVVAYRAGVDLRSANTADPALIDEVDSFLADALGV